jgi:hypothetical protein
MRKWTRGSSGGRGRIAVWLLALAAGGCSASQAADGDAGATDADADTDSDTDTDSDADADADTDTGDGFPWDWGCGIVLDTTCDDYGAAPSPYSEQMLDFDALGVTGIHASGSATAILGERVTEAGIEPIVLVWRAWTDTAVEVGLIDPPADPLRAIDIVSREGLFYGDDGLDPADSVLGYAAVALLCAETWCGLWGLAVDEANEPVGLEAIPDGEVPIAAASALARIPELIYEDSEDPERVCAAGDGVSCFDGTTWAEELPPGGDALLAIGFGPDAEGWPDGMLAAGANGRLVTNRNGDWEEIDTGTSIWFTAVSARDGIWAAGGDGGFVFGDAEHAVACTNDEVDYSAILAHPSYETWSGVGVSALSTAHVFEVWERFDTEPGSCVGATGYLGAPRDAGIWPFGADITFGYALTTRGLYLRAEYSGIDSK